MRAAKCSMPPNSIRWYAEECCHVLGEVAMAPASGARILVQYQPIGIALLITPWNYPAAMATRKIAPGAGGRLHRGAQARHRNAAHRLCRRPDHA